MQVGDLVKLPGRTGYTVWLVSRLVCDTIFVHSLKTGYSAWMNKAAFEVISESR